MGARFCRTVFFVLNFALLCLFFVPAVSAQEPASGVTSGRIPSKPNLAHMVQLPGQLPRWAASMKEMGRVAPGTRLEHLALLLARAPAVEANFQQLLLDQQDPASPRYHQWLTPQQTGEVYGVAQRDLDTIARWLKDQGLSVEGVSTSRVFITFSGDASSIERAFATEIRHFAASSSNSEQLVYGIIREPSVPADLAPVIAGIVGLSTQVHHVSVRKTQIMLGSDSGISRPRVEVGTGMHWLLPADFATIYDIGPVYKSGINGSGQRIAIIGASEITPSDISSFESLSGLAASQPTAVVVPGYADPGATGNGMGGPGDDNQNESTLDVDRVIGTAPGSPIDLVLVPTLTDAAVLAAVNFAIGTLNDPILSISFGRCEAQSTASDSASFNAAFSAGQAQGVSIFVASGDSEVAGCADAGSTYTAGLVQSTNLLCPPSVTCVGGTQFADTASSATYWSPVNGAGNGSAIGYIPEGVWNEPALSTSSYGLLGGGGGPSVFYLKPAWQRDSGQGNDGARDTPDISLSASAHNAYLACTGFDGATCMQTGNSTPLAGLYGTSAAAPGMAAIAALLDQRLGGRQGNINPLLYRLAAGPGNGAIHDATPASSGVTACDLSTASPCNSSTPGANGLTGGLAGFALTTGYDQATGLGSVDVANLLAVAAAAGTAPTTTTLSASAISITTGQTITFTAVVASSVAGSPVGSVQFSVDGAAQGTPVGLSGGTASSTLAFTAGAHSVSAAYSGDSNFASSSSAAITITAVALTPSVSITVSPAAITTAGTANVSFTVSGGAGAPVPTGSVTLSSGTTVVSSLQLVNGTASGSVGGLAAGVYSIFGVYSGDSVYVAARSAATNLTVTAAPGLTLTSTPRSLTMAAGAVSGNAVTLTYTSTNGFAGTVAQSCSLTFAGSNAVDMPTCVFSTASISLAAGGTATSAVTLTSTTPHAPTANAAKDGGWVLRAVLTMSLLLMPKRRIRRRGLGVALMLGMLLVGAGGCGSNITVPGAATLAGTTAGKYLVTVTGASGAVTVATVIPLTIQ